MTTFEAINDPSRVGKFIRNSNLELLRLICMFYIVLHHILIHALHQVAGYEGNLSLSLNSVISTILDGFLIVAVNSFILISGYFSIKLKIKKLIHLYIVCATYGALFYFFHLYVDGQTIGKTFLAQSLFVISNTQDWWFIQSYFFLCLFSPILNRATDNMDKKEHLSVIIALAFLNIYFGYFWQNPFNADGYNVMNFIFIYLIGQYIKKYISIPKLKTDRNKIVAGYVCFSTLLGAWVLVLKFILRQHKLTGVSWAYNNPFIILSSILFFYIFLTINIRNSRINWWASSVLAVYLIHENSYIKGYIYNGIHNICRLPLLSANPVFQYAALILFTLVLMAACLCFDKFFQTLVRPVEKWMLFFWNKIEAKCRSLIH